MARACEYCTYGPVSPSKRTTSSKLKSKLLILSFFKSWKTTAPTPTASATSSLSARFGFFSSICLLANLTASSKTSSNKITRPERVDNFLPPDVINPNGI